MINDTLTNKLILIQEESPCSETDTYIHTYIHTYIASVSELLCLIPVLVGSSVATVCPPERDTALRTAVTTVTRVPL